MRLTVRSVLAVSTFFGCVYVAQVLKAQDVEPARIFTPASISWKEEMAILAGDPDKPGPFVLRIRMPDGVAIPPHWHPEDENITVVEGVFLMGMGDKFDRTAMKEMPAGSFATMPKGMHHFVSCHGVSVVQLHGMGPLVFKWVNPEDDPNRKKP